MLKRALFLTLVATTIFADDEIPSTPKIIEQMKVIPDQLKPAVTPERFLKPESSFPWIDFSIYGGRLDGKSIESYKYLTRSDETGIAEYEWNLEKVWILGGQAKFNVYEDYLFFTLGGWNKVSSSPTDMVAKDWDNPASMIVSNTSRIYSHLEKAYQITGELTCKFLTFNIGHGNFKLGSLFGYESMNFEWGTLRGSGFEEKIAIPYFGFAISIASTAKFFKMDLFSRLSPYASMKECHSLNLKETNFDKSFQNGKYFNIGLTMCSHVWKGLYFDMKYYYERFIQNSGQYEYRTVGKDPIHYQGGIATFHSHANLMYGFSVLF
ncbi:MAG: omptin family outer membrane protease [Verrucomicrobia bacterium]|nr:omptin family outer membrane protease [Verrucomicrobiota bacterium]